MHVTKEKINVIGLVIGLVLVATVLGGCATAPTIVVQSTTIPPGITATLKIKESDNEENGDYTSPAKAPMIFDDSIATVTRKPSSDKEFKLIVEVSKDRLALENWEARNTPITFQNNSNQYVVKFGDIPGGVEHNRLVRLKTRSDGESVFSEFYFRYQKRWEWSGISAPILLRARGSAATFLLENLAPSLATGIKYNLSYEKFRFVAGNALMTVFSHTDDKNSQSYSLALGGVADVAGYFQVGSTYHFGDKTWYLVFGLRPERYEQLFGNKNGK